MAKASEGEKLFIRAEKVLGSAPNVLFPLLNPSQQGERNLVIKPLLAQLSRAQSDICRLFPCK